VKRRVFLQMEKCGVGPWNKMRFVSRVGRESSSLLMTMLLRHHTHSTGLGNFTCVIRKNTLHTRVVVITFPILPGDGDA
jgi:hypothetical protein